MLKWFKSTKAKTVNLEKMFGHPMGIFHYVKNKYRNEFEDKIINSLDKQIYRERVFPSSFDEIRQYPELDKCDFSGETFNEGEEITKYWIVNK